MNLHNLSRKELIQNYLPLQVATGAGDLIILWEKIAIEIISLVGEDGFNSLYQRSISLNQLNFPWLVLDSPGQIDGRRFTPLLARFEEQSLTQSKLANARLLITFTDIVASLIGDQITFHILQSVLADEKSDGNIDKELKNE